MPKSYDSDDRPIFMFSNDPCLTVRAVLEGGVLIVGELGSGKTGGTAKATQKPRYAGIHPNRQERTWRSTYGKTRRHSR